MTLSADLNNFIDPILSAFTDNLTYRLNGHLVTAYLRGSAQMVQWGRTKLTDQPIFYEGPPTQQAMTYAQKRAALLIKDLNDETRDQMRGVIEYAIKKKRGIPGLSRDLRKQFINMSRIRAKMIARTETANALETAFMDRSKDMGVTGKEIITGDPCEICQANAAEGIVPIDHVFLSGDKSPPFHPNCVCALAPVMLK